MSEYDDEEHEFKAEEDVPGDRDDAPIPGWLKLGLEIAVGVGIVICSLGALWWFGAL